MSKLYQFSAYFCLGVLVIYLDLSANPKHPSDLIVRGHLGRDQVVDAMTTVSQDIQLCYKELLKSHKNATGKITIEMTVKAKTTKASTCDIRIDEELSSNNTQFPICVRSHACKAVFPRPKIETTIEYPLTLVP